MMWIACMLRKIELITPSGCIYIGYIAGCIYIGYIDIKMWVCQTFLQNFSNFKIKLRPILMKVP